MRINRTSSAMAAAFLLSGLWASAALAHPGSGGGFGGGGHAGGGHAGVSMGHGSAGRAGSSRVATQQFAARGFSGARAFSGARSFSAAPVAHWSAPAAGVSRGFSHSVVASAGFRGRAFGPGFGRGLGWRGGIWGGRFWPGVSFGLGVAWFLPVLPLYYSTFWWDSVPYYYCNNAYYTWSQDADGYVVTDPPPATAAAPADSGAGANVDGASAPSATQPQPQGSAPQINDNVYAYPGNGQSEDQQALDRQQCDQWAASQVGGTTAGSPDFRRAVIACFQGRGYSAQ